LGPNQLLYFSDAGHKKVYSSSLEGEWKVHSQEVINVGTWHCLPTGDTGIELEQIVLLVLFMYSLFKGASFFYIFMSPP
jgi:hypothetical protein